MGSSHAVQSFTLRTHSDCITVFSAPNYLGHARNKGAVVKLTLNEEGHLTPSFITYEPQMTNAVAWGRNDAECKHEVCPNTGIQFMFVCLSERRSFKQSDADTNLYRMQYSCAMIHCSTWIYCYHKGKKMLGFWQIILQSLGVCWQASDFFCRRYWISFLDLRLLSATNKSICLDA